MITSTELSDDSPLLSKRKIHLASEPVILIDGADKLEGNADISLRLLPRPALIIEAQIPEDFFRMFGRAMGGDPVVLEFPRLGISPEVYVVSCSASATSTLTGVPKREPLIIGEASETASLEFRLLNYPDIIAQAADGTKRIFREIHIVIDGWEISLWPEDDIQDTLRNLKAEGGYGVTHRGRIRRTDSVEFSIRAVEDILDCLYYFFSFSRGFWSGPLLPTAYDVAGERVWARWGASNASEWRGTNSWFDHHRADLLQAIFPSFWALWRNPVWKSGLERTIYWYLASNSGSGGIEGGVMLSQTALELLAWTYLVEDRKALSRDGFKRLPAADQLRLLLSHLGIPTELPAELAELSRSAKEYNWNDGPTAFVELRNSIVHPSDSARILQASFGTRWEAWNLGQWYVELVLLRLSNYNGEYACRLQPRRWVGQVQQVPWVE